MIKKNLIAMCIFVPLFLPVFASDITKTLKASIEKNSSDFTHFFIYEEFLKTKKDKGHSFEIFGYNSNSNIMCSLLVVNLFTRSDLEPIIFDNSQNNICFGLRQYDPVNKSYYAIDYDRENGYFKRVMDLTFKNNFNEIYITQHSVGQPHILQQWHGARTTFENLEKTTLDKFKK